MKTIEKTIQHLERYEAPKIKEHALNAKRRILASSTEKFNEEDGQY